ncbi:MAG: oligosaccharide flippase family protein [Candidatus Peribacteria bacterium]|nr:oligosaccharide flippase family protein [Candidatus Peribacteria bacterium]
MQDESLAKKLITKGFWVYFFVFLAAPIGYILRMFLSNSVSVAEVGIFYSVLGLITLLITYNDLGLTESLQYFIPKYWIAGEKSKVKLSIVVSFLMQMITGILIFCGLYFGTEWLASHHFQSPLAFEIIRILAFYFL